MAQKVNKTREIIEGGRSKRGVFPFLKFFFFFTLALLLVAGAGAGYFWYSVVSACPGECIAEDALRDIRPKEASIVYDNQGREMGSFYEYEANRRNIGLEQVPEHVLRAFVAVEDQRFFEHPGFDLRRIGGSLIANIKKGEAAQGSSTLTMQLARNLYPDLIPPTEKTLRRKALEAHVAWRMEQSFSKKEILQHYLNTIYLGSGAYGIEVASRIYFNKEVEALSVAEGALLAALPKAPSRLDPYKNPESALQRRNLVLSLMRSQGLLTSEEATSAQQSPLGLAFESARGLREGGRESTGEGYVMEQVKKELEPLFGNDIYGAGLRIFLTIDPGHQKKAEQVLEERIRRIEDGEFGAYRASRRTDESASKSEYLQGALVLLDASNGGIRAMVGGRSFQESPFNRALQAERQPGSAFKPFVFAAALESGFSPFHTVLDTPIEIDVGEDESWRPRNYGGESGGAVTLTNALKLSRNRATVRLAQEVGMEKVVEISARMGLDGDLPTYPSVALGSAEVNVLELTAAYLPIARTDGTKVRPYLIEKVLDRDGKVIFSNAPVLERAIEPSVAFALRYMLREVVDHGTGYPVRAAGYDGPAFGKTGTTSGASDLWFVGGTPEYVAGIWLGFDEPKEILRGANGTGGRLVAPIWGELMSAVSPEDRKEDWTLAGDLNALAPWLSESYAGAQVEDSLTFPTEEPTLLGAQRDTARLCVRPRTAEDVGTVSFLVRCRDLAQVQE